MQAKHSVNVSFCVIIPRKAFSLQREYEEAGKACRAGGGNPWRASAEETEGCHDSIDIPPSRVVGSDVVCFLSCLRYTMEEW